MIVRLAYMTAAIAILVAMTGCNDALVHEGEPQPIALNFIASCNGENVVLQKAYIGTEIFVYADFDTFNVNQDFESEVLIDSPSALPDQMPQIGGNPTFSVVNTEPGSAKGIVRVSFFLALPCYSDGPYQITIVIRDENQDSAKITREIEVTESPISSTAACSCVSQCGECTFVRYSIAERCLCGCPLFNEKCN